MADHGRAKAAEHSNLRSLDCRLLNKHYAQLFTVKRKARKIHRSMEGDVLWNGKEKY